MTKNTLLPLGVIAIALLALSFFVLPLKIQAAYGLTAAGAPICGNSTPGTPAISSIKSLGGGSVELSWNGVSSSTSWTVAYGVKSGTYLYGLGGFGDSSTRTIKVNSLPGGTYYFVVRANNACMPGAFSGEKSISTGGTGTGSTQPVTFTTTGTTQPRATVSPAASASPRATTRVQATPTPFRGLPTATPVPQGGVSFWQSILNFFASLFGGK